MKTVGMHLLFELSPLSLFIFAKSEQSLLQYTQFVDQHARNMGRTPEFKEQNFFGQLGHILILKLLSAPKLNLAEPTSHRSSDSGGQRKIDGWLILLLLLLEPNNTHSIFSDVLHTSSDDSDLPLPSITFPKLLRNTPDTPPFITSLPDLGIYIFLLV